MAIKFIVRIYLIDNTAFAKLEAATIGLLSYFAKQNSDDQPAVFRMTSKLRVALCAADTDAALVLCGENLKTSKPACVINQRVRVSLLTSLKGFT